MDGSETAARCPGSGETIHSSKQFRHSDHNTTAIDYISLTIDYNTPTTDYNSLTIDYNTPTTDYNSLTIDYNIRPQIITA
ncbi:hypothetical protein Btru_067606 [Bulinus truncatus]|nr:hypothetical protein Btru_067606 [Bulinus truncatus]